MSEIEILKRAYCGEDLGDIPEDVYDAVNRDNIPCDEHGFSLGHWHVSVVWKSLEEDKESSVCRNNSQKKN